MLLAPISDLAIRDELPILIVRDVNTWFGATLVSIGAAVYLGWSMTTGQPFGDVEFIASGVLLLMPAFALIGSREIRLYRDWMVVIRRGKVRLNRPLDELVRLRTVPFSNVHWAVFRGPSRVLLFSNAGDWRRLVDYCRARVRARG